MVNVNKVKFGCLIANITANMYVHVNAITIQNQRTM